MACRQENDRENNRVCAVDMSESVDECLERLCSPPGDTIDYDVILRDSVTLLTAPGFADRLPAWQVAAIKAVFARIIATSHAQAGAVAALAARHFGRLLRDPRTDLAQA